MLDAADTVPDLDRTAEMPKPYGTMKLLQLSRSFGLRYRQIAASILLTGIVTVVEGASLLLVMPIVDILQHNGDISAAGTDTLVWRALQTVVGAFGIPLSLGVLLALFFVLVVIRQAVRYGATIYSDRMELRLVSTFRSKAFRSLLNASLDFFDRNRAGNVVNDIGVEWHNAVRAFLNNIRLVSDYLMMAFYGFGALALSPIMTVVAVAVFVLIGFILRVLFRRQERLGYGTTHANQVISSRIVDRIRAIRLVRLAGIEKEERAAFEVDLEQQYQVTYASRKVGAVITNATEPIILGATLAILYFGVTWLQVPLSKLFLLLLVVLRLMPVFRDIMIATQAIKSASGSLLATEKLREVLAHAAEPAGGTRILKGIEQAVIFDDVSFAYGTRDVPVLSNVSLTIPAGRVTALVGPSGSGKSTLIDLIPRLRTPDSGTIRIDGVPIDDFDVISLRKLIAFVPQSPVLLNLTVGEHIRCGNPDATEADVVSAAKLAGAHDFIEKLPKGYDTSLGEAGRGLSGGQLQRLDCARALARKAAILILDEPTSNLDAELERQFRQTVAWLRAQTKLTIIIIAHRLSTIRDSDQIVLLREGRIEGIGTHDSLIRDNQWYASATAQQTAA